MVAILALLLGCPLPPEEPKTNNNNNNRAPQQNSGGAPAQQGGAGGGGNNIGVPPTPGGGNGGNNPAVIQGGAGGAPGGAPGGVLHDLGQLKEQKNQKDILAADHVQIRGTISGECNGPVRLDVLSLTDSPADTQTKGPLTGKDLEGTGEFVIAVPKDSSISLTALCDDNGDQKITEKDDKLSPGARIGKVDSDKDNVELVLESIQPPSGGPDGSPGAGGPGAGGPGAGGPGAGGPGAGGPDAGGPGAGGPDAGGTGAPEKEGSSEKEGAKKEAPAEGNQE